MCFYLFQWLKNKRYYVRKPKEDRGAYKEMLAMVEEREEPSFEQYFEDVKKVQRDQEVQLLKLQINLYEQFKKKRKNKA